MAAITYTELIRRIPIWMYAQNNDLASELPNIVLEAHNQLIGIMDRDLFKTSLGARPVAADGILDLTAESPAVMEVRSLSVDYRAGGVVPLERRGDDYLRALYPIQKPGEPRYYSEDGTPLKLRIWPVPSVTPFDAYAEVNQEPEPLGPGNDTNLLGNLAPRAVEKATLRQAAFFMKEWDTADRYEAEMVAALTEANLQSVRRRRDEVETRPRDTANRQGK